MLKKYYFQTGIFKNLKPFSFSVQQLSLANYECTVYRNVHLRNSEIVNNLQRSFYLSTLLLGNCVSNSGFDIRNECLDRGGEKRWKLKRLNILPRAPCIRLRAKGNEFKNLGFSTYGKLNNQNTTASDIPCDLLF